MGESAVSDTSVKLLPWEIVLYFHAYSVKKIRKVNQKLIHYNMLIGPEKEEVANTPYALLRYARV